jgi:hypothetical protein
VARSALTHPPVQLYTTVPFASIAVFFALYLGIVNNQKFGRFVRFNGQQAILLDVLLILPSLVENVIRMPSGGAGLSIFISICACAQRSPFAKRPSLTARFAGADNTIWLYVAFCFIYAVGSCLAGQKVLLPLVGEGADQQVM